MDTLRQDPDLELSGRRLHAKFLPPELPLAMSKQKLHGAQLRKDKGRAALAPRLAFRRACIFVGTASMTAAGCYEMYEVLQVGGVTFLEWMVLVLFVLLFAWIAFSFMSALAGFAVLLFRIKDPLGIDPDAPLPLIESRNAMLLPTYNENPYQIMARLRAMCQAVEQSGYGTNFDWFVLSDTTNPSVWIEEEKCFLRLREDLGTGNVYYRHRPENTGRKSGNIEDWIKRFGAAYDHMIVLDADSLMTEDTIVRLVSAMESASRRRSDPDAACCRQCENALRQIAAVFRTAVWPANRCRHCLVAWHRRQLLGP